MSDAETLRRAFLPEILLPADVSIALQILEPEAKAMMERGELGPTFRLANTIGILRKNFLAALKKRGGAK